MARPDPTLLEPARYPFSCRIEPRFSDRDVNMHVNNVAMAGLLADGRVRFRQRIGYGDLLVNGKSVVASLQIDYLGEGNHPDPITVHSAIESVGRASHRRARLMTQTDRLIAFARTTLVTVGQEGPSALPDAFKRSLGPWMLAA